MGSVYARGSVLWIAFKDATGMRVLRSTPYRAGQEEEAQRTLLEAERLVFRQQQFAGGQKLLTVAAYAETWLEARENRGLHTVVADRSRLKHHVLPIIGRMTLKEVEPAHCLAIVDAMVARGLAPRTTINSWGVLHRMFADAEFERLIEKSPAVLPRGRLPAKTDADPEWRAGAMYTPSEVVQLITDRRIPAYRRLLYAVCCLGGLRSSEACALKWRHWERNLEPLGRLLVAGSWSTRKHAVKVTKTGAVRLVPVHPRLAELLHAWKAQQPSPPKPDDVLLLPPDDLVMNENTNRKRLHADLTLLGLRQRAVHDMRATHMTLLEDAGANERIWKRWTHGDPRDVVGVYLRTQWSVKCREMLKLSLPVAKESATPVLQSTDVTEFAGDFEWGGGN